MDKSHSIVARSTLTPLFTAVEEFGIFIDGAPVVTNVLAAPPASQNKFGRLEILLAAIRGAIWELLFVIVAVSVLLSAKVILRPKRAAIVTWVACLFKVSGTCRAS